MRDKAGDRPPSLLGRTFDSQRTTSDSEFGQVCLAARAADCKSVTRETPKVRVLPCPLYAPVSQQEEGAGLNPVQCEFESHREYASVAERYMRRAKDPRRTKIQCEFESHQRYYAGVTELEYVSASNTEF